LTQEADRLGTLDRLGDAAALYDAFLHEHSSAAQCEKARRELTELRERIGKRASADLEKADGLIAKNDLEGAEDVLTGVDVYGDDVARGKARTALEALRARAKQQPVEKPPVKPDETPPPDKGPDKPPEQVERPPQPSRPDKGDDGSLLGPSRDLSKVLAGKVEKLDGGKTRVSWDGSVAGWLDDWPLSPREPAWVLEVLESLPPASAPYPYDKARPWTLVKGALYVTGFERHVTKAVFSGGALKIELTAKLLSNRGLVVTLGDPKHPFVVAIAASPPESIPTKGRSKEQQDGIAKLLKKWKATFTKPSIVVAREQDAFDWEPTGLVAAFQPDSKGTHVIIEARRDADGDALFVTVDAQREKIALGKDAFSAGPVGIESFGKPIIIGTVAVEGTPDPAWLKTLPK
jgi:hypothetical protein